jgi:hypothetical protein
MLHRACRFLLVNENEENEICSEISVWWGHLLFIQLKMAVKHYFLSSVLISV